MMEDKKTETRPSYLSPHFEASPYSGDVYVLVWRDTGGAFAYPRTFPNEAAQRVVEIAETCFRHGVDKATKEMEKLIAASAYKISRELNHPPFLPACPPVAEEVFMAGKTTGVSGVLLCPKRPGRVCETPIVCSPNCLYEGDDIHPNRIP